jgi:hypothetical protein
MEVSPPIGSEFICRSEKLLLRAASVVLTSAAALAPSATDCGGCVGFGLFVGVTVRRPVSALLDRRSLDLKLEESRSVSFTRWNWTAGSDAA